MKISSAKLLDSAKLMATKIGREIPDFFTFVTEFTEQTIRALRNGLTFEDIFLCQQKTISLLHGQAQSVQTDQKVIGIIPLRLVSQTYLIRDFGWYYDDQGKLTVKANFDSDPGQALNVVIVLLF